MSELIEVKLFTVMSLGYKLYDAAGRGDMEEVERLLDEWANIEYEYDVLVSEFMYLKFTSWL